MSHDEEISLLRRELADLRDRVARFEAPISPAIELSKLGLPLNGNVFLPATSSDCGCGLGTLCMNAACPRGMRTTTWGGVYVGASRA